MSKFTWTLWAMIVVAMIPVCTLAKDQGSVLVYNLYASRAANDPAQNTRISITNTNETTGVAVHLFFVDGTTCLVTDAYLCLAAQQSAAFLASDVDPGVTGYVMAFATDANGLPIAFDWLIGDEYVKLLSGHQASLSAEAISVLSSPSFSLSADGALATIRFDGVGYERLPRVLAIDSIAHPFDGNSTVLVLNHIGGSLATRVSPGGTIFCLIYDDAESAYSSSILFFNSCQVVNTFSNSFPRTLGFSFPMIISHGRTGWVKLWNNTNALSYFGAVLNRNNRAETTAFNGGHNLHKLTLNPISFIQIPIAPPRC